MCVWEIDGRISFITRKAAAAPGDASRHFLSQANFLTFARIIIIASKDEEEVRNCQNV